MTKNVKWMISAILLICGTIAAQAAQNEKNTRINCSVTTLIINT